MDDQLVPIEFNNQRIMLTKTMADQFGATETMITQNFNNNKDRFVDGKHFIKLQGDNLKGFKRVIDNIDDPSIKFASVLMLWTDRGAARHAKILETDEAWEVYEKLEETYFNVQAPKQQYHLPSTYSEALRELAAEIEKSEKLQLENNEMKPKSDFYDAVAGSSDAIEMAHASKVLAIKGYGRNNLFEYLREKKVLDNNNIPYQKYVDAGYFRVIEQKYNKGNGETAINIKTLIYQRGLDFIRKLIAKQEVS